MDVSVGLVALRLARADNRVVKQMSKKMTARIQRFKTADLGVKVVGPGVLGIVARAVRRLD